LTVAAVLVLTYLPRDGGRLSDPFVGLVLLPMVAGFVRLFTRLAERASRRSQHEREGVPRNDVAIVQEAVAAGAADRLGHVRADRQLRYTLALWPFAALVVALPTSLAGTPLWQAATLTATCAGLLTLVVVRIAEWWRSRTGRLRPYSQP
jgi:hypothetical protein